MKNKELRRMSRRELIEIIYEMKQREIALLKKYAELEKKWEDRELRLSKIGSLAEASMAFYDIMDKAQKTADMYVNGVKQACKQAQQRIIEDQQKQAAQKKTASGGVTTQKPSK